MMRDTARNFHLIALLIFLALALFANKAIASPGDISTIAGGGTPIVKENQSAMSFASSVGDIVFDAAGNYYYSDSFNHLVYKVDPRGYLSVVAGSGKASYTDDSNLATEIGIPYPSSLAFDSNQNLYIADGNNCIRKVNGTGIVSTLFCNNDAPSNAHVFAFDNSDNLYYIAIQTDINYTSNYFLKKRELSTNKITTVAGFIDNSNTSSPSYNFNFSGQATAISLTDVTDIYIDTSNNIYLAESGRDLVRKIDSLGMLTTVAGDGTNGYTHDGGKTGVLATATGLSNPTDVIVDKNGNLLITDSGNHQIRKVDTQGVITTVAGSGIGFPRKSGDGGLATDANLYNPSSVAIAPSGAILIADTGNFSIRMVDSTRKISTVAGTGSPSYTGDQGQATSSQLYKPSDVISDSAGNLYIADSLNHRVRKIDTTGVITTIAGIGTPGYNGDNILATNAMLYSPTFINMDNDGNLFITDRYNHRIRKVSSKGVITTVAGGGNQDYNEDNSGIATKIPIELPGDITTDEAGNLYIIEDFRILKVTPSGTFTKYAGTFTPGYSGDNGPAINAELRPTSLAMDNQGNLWIGVDNHIRQVDTSGIITTIAGTGFEGSGGDNGPAIYADISSPDGITVDNIGNIYFSDHDQGNIRKIDLQGIITHVDNSSLNNPKGISVNQLGDIYVAEEGANLVRKVEGNPPQVIPMYRLYYPKSGAHLYTSNEIEYNTLASVGWIQENIAFKAFNKPSFVENQVSTAWLRLYNPYTKRHHWTTSNIEYNFLGAIGWLKEGPTVYLFQKKVSGTTPLYRLYNPNNGTHHWTLDSFEKNFLVSLGWLDEGVTGYVYKN